MEKKVINSLRIAAQTAKSELKGELSIYTIKNDIIYCDNYNFALKVASYTQRIVQENDNHHWWRYSIVNEDFL